MKSSRRIASGSPYPGPGAEVEIETEKGKVLRLRAGEAVEIFFPGEGYAEGEVTALSRGRIRARIISPLRSGVPASSAVVAFAPPKGARLDWAVEKLTEAGVGNILLVPFERSVREGTDTARLERIALAAAMQSGCNGTPEIRALASFEELLAEMREGYAARVILDADAPAPLACVDGRILLVIGPEGGVAAEEKERLLAAGAVPKTLGLGVYRTETAAVVAAGILRLPVASGRP